MDPPASLRIERVQSSDTDARPQSGTGHGAIASRRVARLMFAAWWSHGIGRRSHVTRTVLRRRGTPGRGARERGPGGRRPPRHGVPIGRLRRPWHGRGRAAARRAGRHRRAAGGWQRRGRGDRRERLPRLDGAHRERHGRRPVRDRLGSEAEAAGRPQCLREIPARPRSQPDPARSGRHDPAVLALFLERARLRGRLGRTACALRQAAARTRPRPGDRLRGEWVSALAGDRGRLGAQCARVQGQARLCRGVHARRPCARSRRSVPQSGAREDAAPRRGAGPRCVLQGPDRRRDRAVLDVRAAGSSRGRISRNTTPSG